MLPIHHRASNLEHQMRAAWRPTHLLLGVSFGQHGTPEKITIDKSGANTAAIASLTHPLIPFLG
jgi:transposase-like protein